MEPDKLLEVTTPDMPEAHIFSREENHRVFVVLKIGQREFTERIPRQVLKFSARMSELYTSKVIDRLKKKAGIKRKSEAHIIR